MTVQGLYDRNPRDLIGWQKASDPASPDTFYRQNLPRVGLTDSAGDTNHVALADTVMTSVAIPLVATDKITSITFFGGNTAIGTPAHWWFALYDNAGTPALLGQSADQVDAAWAANTHKTLALASPVTISKTGIYWAAIMVDATSVNTLLGAMTAPAVTALGDKDVAVTSGTALAATAPATITSATAKRFVPRVVLT